MLVSPLINIEPSESLITQAPVKNRQQNVGNNLLNKRQLNLQKLLRTTQNRGLRKVKQGDSQKVLKKDFQVRKEIQVEKAIPDSLWNIYTGNPGLYSAEGDTIAFGNVQYLPDSLFLSRNNKESATVKSWKPIGFEGKIFHARDQEWLLGIVLIIWIIFASVRAEFNNYIRMVMGGLVKVSTATRLFRERGYKTLYGAVRLDLIFHLILPLSVFQILNYYNVNFPGYHDILFYLILLVALNGYFFIKYFLYNLIGSVLMLKDNIVESVFNMKLYYKALGIFLLPVVTIHAVQYKIGFISVWVMAGLIALFYVTSLFRSIYIGNRNGISIFYLILYFCMLEIFPLILIFKILQRE